MANPKPNTEPKNKGAKKDAVKTNHSAISKRYSRLHSSHSMSPDTDTQMIDANRHFGIKEIKPASPHEAKARNSAATICATGVFAPALAFTAEREKLAAII